MAISNLVNQTTPSTMQPKSSGTDLWKKLQLPKQQGLMPTPKVPGPVKPPAQQPQQQPVISSGTQNQVYTAPGTSAGQPIQQNVPAIQTGNVLTPSGATVNAQTGSLVQAPAQNVRGLFPDVVSSIANRGTYQDPFVKERFERASQLTEQLRQSRMNQAQGEASQRLAPIPIGDATGRQAIIRGLYEQQQAALANELQGQTALAGVGIQQAGLQQTALGTAAGFAQPALGAFGQGYYNPLDPTGGAAGAAGGALNPINNVDAIAEQVINGQLSPAQAYSMGGNVPNWQTLLNTRITGRAPNFNVAQAQARYDATQQAGTIAGVTPTSVAANVYGDAYSTFNAMRGQVMNVDSLGDLLLDVARSGVINPTDLTIGNKTIADIKRNLSTAEQVKFDSALSAFSGAASQLLASGSGQIPTAVSENIAKIANGTLSLPALNAMVQQAKREGTVKLQTAASLVNVPGATIGAPQVTAPNEPVQAPIKTGTTKSGIKYSVSP